ncbi:MAG: MBL fold metallo-hydrolase [Methanomicrobiales archaeon]
MSIIKTIKLEMLGGLTSVNCYLIQEGSEFFLIDTGMSRTRKELEKNLEESGCKPKNLNLVLITHGDSDHIGNCAYLQQEYGAQIAMHNGDFGMAEYGDMLWNRKGNILSRIISPFMGLSKSERFKPDIYVEDGDDLKEYGLDAKIIHIPGHSSGSIGILTNELDLFCGDLFSNTKKPALNSIMDDKIAAKASIEKLENLNINYVYPGHGDPFRWDQLAQVID